MPLLFVVVLAAAMWNQPHILILDEPTNYLDRESLGALAGIGRFRRFLDWVGILFLGFNYLSYRSYFGVRRRRGDHFPQ